jgi:hypothetical protein
MMNLRRIATVMLIATGGVLVAVPASPTAASVSGIHVHLFGSTVSGVSGQKVRATVLCPATWKVVSVGASGNRISSILPLPNFNGVTATGVIWTGPTMTVEAGCAPESELQGVRRLSLRNHETTPGLRSDIQRCPAGMFAFGGGGEFAPSGEANDMDANTMTADGTGWLYAGNVVNRGDSTQVVTQCAPDTGGTFQTSAAMPGQEGVFQYVVAQCPAPFSALSGGAYLANPDGSVADALIVRSDSTGAGWQVQGTAPIGGKVVALVRCTL